MSVINTDGKDYLSKKLFFDGDVGISRFDKQKYPWIEKLTRQQIGNFWVPEEIDLTKDYRDYKHLTEAEKHIFVSNIKRQILLDSIQSRSPSLAFLPICSLPELENWITLWSFNEGIHSRSYTHIIRNIYPDPSIIFDGLMDIQQIIECSYDISRYYDDLIDANVIELGFENCYGNYGHKSRLWRALMSVNILEGIRFYASFACSWAFGEAKKMEGNAKIIRLIAKDENVHLAFTQQLIKSLPKDDPEMKIVMEETEAECIQMFEACVKQEKAWATYLFRDGSIIGLNEKLLQDYVEYIADKRMKAIGLKSPFKIGANPLPWTQRWISSSDVQVAPQETEIVQYQIGGVKNDIANMDFGEFKL